MRQVNEGFVRLAARSCCGSGWLRGVGVVTIGVANDELCRSSRDYSCRQPVEERSVSKVSERHYRIRGERIGSGHNDCIVEYPHARDVGRNRGDGTEKDLTRGQTLYVRGTDELYVIHTIEEPRLNREFERALNCQVSATNLKQQSATRSGENDDGGVGEAGSREDLVECLARQRCQIDAGIREVRVDDFRRRVPIEHTGVVDNQCVVALGVNRVHNLILYAY